MEGVDETHNASKCGPEEEDVINKMPENVITNILNCLPLRNAVATSILARNWRFKWTMLTRFVFDREMCMYLLGRGSGSDDGRKISKLLFSLKGPITGFALYISEYNTFKVADITRWINFLSTNGIKDIGIVNRHTTPAKLPTRIFGCLELEHLLLCNCSFQAATCLSSFSNLLNISLDKVTFQNGNFWDVITQCPSLMILIIGYRCLIGKVKLVEIAKLQNLKVLYLPLHMLDNVSIHSSTIFQLPNLHELHLNFRGCKLLGETGTTKWVCSAFPCLKTLQLDLIDLDVGSNLSFAFKIIRGSPNLQTLTITPPDENEDDDPPPTRARTSSEVDYNTLGQLQLRHVFIGTYGSKKEVCLIKHLLGCSPLLKKIIIDSSAMSTGKLKLAKKLLMLPRASTVAKVELRS